MRKGGREDEGEGGGWRGREDEGVEGVLGYYEHLQVDLVDAAKK